MLRPRTTRSAPSTALTLAPHPANPPTSGSINPFRVLLTHRNFRLFWIGQTVSLGDLFTAGDDVDVTGVSKGKGFAGHIKRHNFARGPKTHGSDHHRAPGSIGAGTYPGRVWKGTRMAGQMGNERVTVKKLTVVRVDPERNLILVKGAVPGARNGLLLVQKAK